MNTPSVPCRRTNVWTFEDIAPATSVDDAIVRGCFDLKPSAEDRISLPPLRDMRDQKKNLTVISFGERTEEAEYVPRMSLLGKRPCTNGPHFLLGLFATVPFVRWPKGLLDHAIVAANPAEPSPCLSLPGNNDKVFFYAAQYRECMRVLAFATAGGWWSGDWCFLAEDA